MPETIDLKDPEKRDALGARAVAAAGSAAKPTLIGMNREEMGEALRQAGVSDRQVKMRVQQLWHWLYVRGVSDFADMLNVSKDLRAALDERYTIARPEIVDEQISEDGTRKWLLRFCAAWRRQAGARSKRSTFPNRAAEHCAFQARLDAR